MREHKQKNQEGNVASNKEIRYNTAEHCISHALSAVCLQAYFGRELLLFRGSLLGLAGFK